MKKIVIAVIALLFLVSVFVGFRAAAKMSERLQPTESVGENNSISSQQNYLYFHVSDLNGETPFLVSVWGVFINNNESPHLVFVSLYPSGRVEAENWLSTVFRLRRDASLPERLIARIEREYDIVTSGYILVDNFAVSSLEAWLGLRSVTLPQQEPISKQEYQSILTNGEGFFTIFCSQVIESGLKPVLEEIRWTNLLPEHFSTNLSFEELMLAVDTLSRAEKIENCEVFISQ